MLLNVKIAQEYATKDSIVKSVDYPFDFFSDDKNMFAGMQELGDYVPVNVTPPHPMCGHCLPDISSHRGCYPHTISQYL